MSFSLRGHVDLVTGSSKGLGKQIAMTLGQAGAKVCFNYANNREKAEATYLAALDVIELDMDNNRY